MRKKDVLNFYVKIYALINPKDDTVFYVGATKHTLESRLMGHLCGRSGCAERVDFLRELKSKGVCPKIFLLDEVHFKEASIREEFYYHFFTASGFTLLQSRHGFTYESTNSTRMISDWELKKYLKSAGKI